MLLRFLDSYEAIEFAVQDIVTPAVSIDQATMSKSVNSVCRVADLADGGANQATLAASANSVILTASENEAA